MGTRTGTKEANNECDEDEHKILDKGVNKDY